MITVLTWFWKQPGGRTEYTPEHVNIWAAMVRRHLRQPHRLACVTASPEGIDPSIEIIAPPGDFENIRLPTWGREKPQCLRRIAMFAPDAGKIFGERFLCMDLDCVIAGPMDPLIDTDARFKMYQGTNGTRPYNGSMLYMVAGSRPEVYERLTPEEAIIAGERFTGSDQAWISHVLGRGEAVWTADQGVLWWGSSRNGQAPMKRLMFFPGHPKPWVLARTGEDEWISEHYRGERSGRCLILGYAPGVWAEAEAIMAEGPIEAVIASPEAAEHWPGPILDTARNDREALRLARMYGFNEIAFAGRTLDDLEEAA